ncbi:MAG: hypothetical protein HY316_04645 [Acidobacteria bacterium]|nr:hypothetical protein [Acidobacteriota bacterium]
MKLRMHPVRWQGLSSWWENRRAAWLFSVIAAALLLAAGGATFQAPRTPASHTGSISSTEFSRLIQDFSEPGGYFFSDNFTSNESAYIYIMKPLEKYGTTGGAYVGVGPEQNFTYIAHIRPEIAFIVDIRRQAIIQHLMYKTIFHLAPDRAQFLSILFSKPFVGSGAPQRESPIEEILKYFSTAPSSEDAYRTNLLRLEKTIRQDFQFPLTASDRQDLSYVYNSFYRGDLRISFRMAGDGYGGYWGSRFPNLADLILATDQDGETGNFLVKESDYQFVRKLQQKNRIIPVVGDFGGTKALASVAGYLRQNGYTLSAFYTSNVEQFLFDGRSFPNFVASVRKMPVSKKSVILRAARTGGRMHPGSIPGHRMSPLLVFISVFLKDYDEGLYPDYWSLITTHYISGRQP